MREIPILFKADMIRAILAGVKTETRRLPKWPGKRAPSEAELDNLGDCETVVIRGKHFLRCPFGGEGDRLWVRETWAEVSNALSGGHDRTILYRATYDGPGNPLIRWKSAIHIFRRDARILLDVTEYADIERLQLITEEGALKEGVEFISLDAGHLYRDYSVKREVSLTLKSARESYRTLWEMINGRGSWDKNPLVWVVKFRLHAPK